MVTEDEKGWLKGIELEIFLYDHGKTINRLSKIGRTTSDIDIFYFMDV